jgi:hypothetical protein
MNKLDVFLTKFSEMDQDTEKELIEGFEYYFHQSGQKYRELNYSNNKLISSKEWNEDGSEKE